MHIDQPTELDQERAASSTDGELFDTVEGPAEEPKLDQPVAVSEDANGVKAADDETEALAAFWASNHEVSNADQSSENANSVATTEHMPAEIHVEPEVAPTDTVVDALAQLPVDTVPIPTDDNVDAPIVSPVEVEPAATDVVIEPAAESSTGAGLQDVVEPAPDLRSDAAARDAVAVEQAVESGEGAVQASLATEKTESKPVHDEASDQKLIAEVAAAPHKVYLLNRVKKAVAAAGENERATQLKAVEEQILAEIATRTAAKEALCERAEALKDSTAWKVTGDAFKALFDEWKQVGAAGRELDDQLWARFNLARGAFNERRSKHFEEREIVWSANRELKAALCVEAEALADSTAWKATADAIRDLQAKWKAVGSAGREKDEALWARFNTAKQKFFDNRTAAWEENRMRKEALVIDAETLKDSSDWRSTGDAMKAMQTEWKNVGPAGRDHEDELWSRFRAATQEFFDRRSAVFAERNQAEHDNSVKKTELCQRAEALLYAGDALSAAREAKDLQAEWKEIGPVPREQSESLWARFREACDKIFANASGERDRQQNEWHVRMREAMTRKREQLSSLRESIAHDEANIERWRESLSTLKPGGKSEEIGKSLEDKIIDVMGRIREKQERAEDLKSSINDIDAKLKE